jgi:hypothetical protein
VCYVKQCCIQRHAIFHSPVISSALGYWMPTFRSHIFHI